MKKIAAICLLILLICCFAACSPAEKTARGFSMGSEYYVTYQSSSDISAEVSELLSSIEGSFSAREEGSVIFRINTSDENEMVVLLPEENRVLGRCFAVAKDSGDAFDPAILPLVRVWGFDPPYEMNGGVPPAEGDILTARLLSDRKYFIYSEEKATVVKTKADAALDLGGAIKGYAAERVRDLAKEKCSEALVYVGGTIAAVGRNYPIGVTAPRDSEESYAFRFTLEENEICATSGDYERYYLYNGERYHHILDSKTGYPASSGVISATIVSEDGILADALATAVVVLGAERGVALMERCGVKGAIVTSDKKIIARGITVTVKDTSYEVE